MKVEAFTGGRRWLLVIVSIASSLIYFFTLSLQPYPGSIILKGLSVSTLAAVVFFGPGPPERLILAASLLFSSLGDVLLENPGERMFLLGLLSFLIAHLLYIVLFARNFPGPSNFTGPSNFPRPRLRGTWQKLLILLLMVSSVVMTIWLWPALGELKGAVIFYICAITAMCISAAMAGFSTRWILTGALLFFISDSLIAINKFKFPLSYNDYLVWATYYVAQFLIASGFLREKGKY